jgi:NTE family protein
LNHFKRKEEPYCLVLSGGGAKGVYHIGAWKALRELDIKVNAFIGNSIGAIIAGFLAQGNEEKLYFIGDNITVDYLVKIPGELTRNGELKVNFKHLSAFRTFYRNTLLGGGLDTSPMREKLNDSLDENIIRKSGNDLGLVTFNISEMKAREIFLEEMEPGKVIDYLMASSAFPGFNPSVIKGKKYIDGGVYANIPYKLARSRGYKKIIIIDISGMGVNKRPNIEGTETIYIKNSINMGGLLDFNREFLNQFIELGYLDTLKTFDVLKGFKYFIVPDRKWEKKFASLLDDPRTMAALSPYLNQKKEDQLCPELKIRSILPHSMKDNRKDLFYNLLECCAVILKLEKIHKYTVHELISLLKEKVEKENKKLEYLDKATSKDEIRRFMRKIRLVLKETSPIESLNETAYHYSLLIDKMLTGAPNQFLRNSFRSIYSEIDGGLFMIDLINKLLIIK